MKFKIILLFLAVTNVVLAGDNDRFKIKNLEMNSEESDMCPVYFNGRVVYSSSRDMNTSIKRIWTPSNLGYYDLYVGDPIGTGELIKNKYFNRGFNKKYNEGPMSFNKECNFVAFTQNYYENKKVMKLKIMTSSNEHGKWDEPIHVPFNNPEYSVGHPALNENASVMYFSSDMPGGFGGTDIYKVVRNIDGTWGIPVNLGEKINTVGNEMFPFIHKDGLLFFSSDGHAGFGGMDIFMAHIGREIGDVEHLEAPINSAADDFSLILSADQDAGYFSSNREDGHGSDDIYSFTNNKKFKNTAPDAEGNALISLIGLITDKKSGSPLANAKIKLIDLIAGGEEILTANENGVFTKGLTDKFLNETINYNIVIEAEGYLAVSKLYQRVLDKEGQYNMNAELELNLTKVKAGSSNLEDMVDVQTIYWDLNSYKVRPDAAIQLDKIVETMNNNPSVYVELGSHTDSRGSDLKNYKLSDARAKAAADYIRSKISNPDRITYKGYGETQLKNRCGNDVNCAEWEHQQNRRTEFRITKF